MITPDLLVYYLANIIKVAQTDGKMHAKAQISLKAVCKKFQVDKKILKEAAGTVAKGGYGLMPVGRFSDKVMNLEDMLFAALVDGTFSEAEREEIQGFVEKIQVTEQQAQTILTETKMKLDIQMAVSECSQCGTNLPPGAKVCPACQAQAG
ncbi:MAG: zinc ribbon domain-containing protein [Desulfobacterales bacterium]|nr:zinc ribbon domain-containing protein [Desulfobacterales bacterium]